MTADTVSTAIERRREGIESVVESHRLDLFDVLPSHIEKKTWLAVVIGALRKDPALRDAATANPGSLMNALMKCAQLGLNPGTEEYYLTPRKSSKTGKEVLGIVGYQGIVELIYRAGAVSSVVVEVVREHDTFTYRPGIDERPKHEIDWFSNDRGDLKGVYAYAVMKDGATSKVIVLNARQIDALKKFSAGADSQYSPWKTNPEAMWLKSAARQLGKWVPTSAEFIREQLRAAQDVAAETPRPRPAGFARGLDDDEPVDVSHLPEDPPVVEAELIDDEQQWAQDATDGAEK